MRNHLEHAPFYICYNNIRNFASENLNCWKKPQDVDNIIVKKKKWRD